jgi:hypothetical protein
MENVNHQASITRSRDCRVHATGRRWLNARNLLIIVSVAGSAGALFLGWDWLVAAGIASIIIAVAPCLVMCALGLCMHRMANKPGQPAESTPPATPGADGRPARAAANDARPSLREPRLSAVDRPLAGSPDR